MADALTAHGVVPDVLPAGTAPSTDLKVRPPLSPLSLSLTMRSNRAISLQDVGPGPNVDIRARSQSGAAAGAAEECGAPFAAVP